MKTTISKHWKKIAVLTGATLIIIASIFNISSAFNMHVKTKTNNMHKSSSFKVNHIKIKDELKQHQIYFDKDSIKVINRTLNDYVIKVDDTQLQIKPNQYIEYKIPTLEGKIAIALKDYQKNFSFEVQDNQIYATKIINNLSLVTSKTLTSKAIPKDAKQALTSGATSANGSASIAGSNNSVKLTSVDPVTGSVSEQAASSGTSQSSQTASTSAAPTSSAASNTCDSVKFSNGTDAMRANYLSMAGQIPNLGSLSSLLGKAANEAIETAKVTSIDGNQMYLITSKNGYSDITGVRFASLIQDDKPEVMSIKLDIAGVMSKNGYQKLVLDDLHTALYKGNISQSKIMEALACQ